MHIHPRIISILKRTGNVLSIVGIVFIVLRLREYGSKIDYSRFSAEVWAFIAGLILLYSIANPMLAFAWRNLLAQFGVRVTRGWAFRIYGISQIAKYVPGNILHLAGRQAMGMSKGVEALPLLKSTAFELGAIAATGSIFGLLILPSLMPAISLNSSVSLFLFFCAFVFFCLYHYAPPLAYAFCWYLAFLVSTGIVFIGLVYLIISNTPSPWAFLCGAYVIAWLAGFVTPGAPAGVGIREMVLLVLLKGMIVETDLLLVVLTGRVVSVGGDMLFFLVSLLAGYTQKESLSNIS